MRGYFVNVSVPSFKGLSILRLLILPFIGSLFILGVFFIGSVKQVNAYACSEQRCCECCDAGTPSGMSCGSCCDSQCEFADENRCDGEPEGGGSALPCDNSYNVRLYIRKDVNHNGNNDPFEDEPPLSGSVDNVPGSIACNGTDWGPSPPFTYLENWIFDPSNPSESARIDTWREIASVWTHELNFMHPDAVYLGMGDLRLRCEERLGTRGNIGYARSFFGRTTGGTHWRKSVVIKVELLDIPLPGGDPYRFGKTFFGDYSLTPEGTGCTQLEDGWQGIPNTDRIRWYLCSPTDTTPVNCGGVDQVYTRNWIDVMIDNQPTVPVCEQSVCSPTTPVSVEQSRPAAVALPLTSEFVFSSLVPSSNVRFVSQDPSVFDFDVNPSNVVSQVDFAALPGSYLGYYSYTASAYGSTDVLACGRSTKVSTQFLDSTGNVLCSCETGNLTLTCSFPPAWYQIGGGDAVSATDDINSDVPPAERLFSSANLGLAIYNRTISPNTSSNIGIPGWNANTAFSGHQVLSGGMYNVEYFKNKFYPASDNVGPSTSIPQPFQADWDAFYAANPGEDHQGYKVYRQDAQLSILPVGIDLRNNGRQDKIIFFIATDLFIQGKIQLDDGIDFIMFIVGGGIHVWPGVGDATYVAAGTPSEADIEGIYVTDGQFITNDDQAVTTNQLYVRGMISSFYDGPESGIKMTDQRDLRADNATRPAEIFEFAPDQLLLFPPFFSEKSITWKEVAP